MLLQDILLQIHGEDVCYFNKTVEILQESETKSIYAISKIIDGKVKKYVLDIPSLRIFVNKCHKNLVGIPISYTLDLKNPLTRLFTKYIGHSLTLIIDKKEKEVLLFNLNSFRTSSYKNNFNTTLQDGRLPKLASIFLSELKYVHTSLNKLLHDIFPEKGWKFNLSELNQSQTQTCSLPSRKDNPLFIQSLIPLTSKHTGSCQVFSLWYTHLRFSHPELTNQELYGAIKDRITQFNKTNSNSIVSKKIKHFILNFFIQLFQRLTIELIFKKNTSSNALVFTLKLTTGKHTLTFNTDIMGIDKIPISFITQTQPNDPYHILKQILKQKLQQPNGLQYGHDSIANILYTPEPSLLTQKLPTLFDELDEIFPIS
jgi:hypothetical protein